MRSLATQSALGNCGNFHSVPFSTATTVVSMLEKAAWDKKFSCLVDLCQQPVSSIFAASYLGFVLRLAAMAVIFSVFLRWQLFFPSSCDGSYFFRLLAMVVIFSVYLQWQLFFLWDKAEYKWDQFFNITLSTTDIKLATTIDQYII